jgi:hypothetical protein
VYKLFICSIALPKLVMSLPAGFMPAAVPDSVPVIIPMPGVPPPVPVVAPAEAPSAEKKEEEQEQGKVVVGDHFVTRWQLW